MGKRGRREPQRPRYWDAYPGRSSPLPADGIKARTRGGQAFGQTWWGGRWIAALERLVNPGRLQRGRSYARRGQVLNIDFAGNRIESRVQGSRREPYKVSVEMKSIDSDRWNKVIDVMASQAIFAAKLLAGEMPQDIEDAFSSARVPLFPERTADLKTECSCPDYANPCKHISAVYYLLAERFDGDPFLLFELRGRSKDQIIEDLRARRGLAQDWAPQSSGAADRSASSDDEFAQSGQRRAALALEPAPAWDGEAVAIGEPGPPLDESLDQFWEPGGDIAALQFAIARPAVDAALVKRLGQPPFWNGKGNFIEEMESLYRRISEAAIKTALGE